LLLCRLEQHVIANASGKIVAAMHGEIERNATLYPLAGQRRHRIENVPADVAGPLQ
jgi:hypothetical protein